MTATAIDPTTRLAEIDRQLTQIDQAYRDGVHGWADETQDFRRRLRQEKADLLGELGRDDERRSLLFELALEG